MLHYLPIRLTLPRYSAVVVILAVAAGVLSIAVGGWWLCEIIAEFGVIASEGGGVCWNC